MNDYELTIVLPGSVSPAKKKVTLGKVEKLVKAHNGEIAKTDEWGKIDLSYKIKKETSGIFTHYNLKMNGVEVKKFKVKLGNDDDIIRYLLVKTSKS